jgi:hypothetical protein
VRIDTGIIAISGLSGNASWSTSQRRSAPAQIAIGDIVDRAAVLVLDFLHLCQ